MLKVELLTKKHVKDHFDCGVFSLNEYLVRFARQNDQKNISRTFVAVDNNKRVFGYYSINTASIEFREIPENIAKGLPRYPIPAVRLSRLAVDLKMQSTGLGERLLINALKRVYLSGREMGIKCIIVDSINDKAKAFYEHYGFFSLPGQEFKLFLSIETINQLFEEE